MSNKKRAIARLDRRQRKRQEADQAAADRAAAEPLTPTLLDEPEGKGKHREGGH